jgi:predicted ATPase
VGVGYFYDKLKEIRKSKNLYTGLESKFREIRRASGSYKVRPVSQKDGFDNGQVRIFRVDKDLRKKNILEYLGTQNITAEECRRLFYFYSNHPFPVGEEFKDDEHSVMIKKILADFHEDDILFDNKLLKRILDIQGEELNGTRVKALLKSEFPDLYDCLIMLKSDSASQVISLLNMKSYCQWEKEFVENEMISLQQINGVGARKEFSSAIEHHLQVILEESPFFRALTELSATREGFLQAYNNYRNLKNLSSFCGLVLDKIIQDLGTDIEKALFISDPVNQTGINVDFNHPLHDQIRKYAENSIRDTFLEDWLKKFNISENLSLDTPLKGLGYFPAIRKGNKNIPLSDAGSGVKRLVMMLMSIANARQREGLRDFNEDPADYPGTIIIESPETNLHSGWQSRFADMIIDARNRTGLNFLIETHSEHLIERLQCLASTGKINKKDLAIYRIDNLCDGAPQLREVNSMDDLNPDDPGEDVSAMELFRLKKFNKN